MGSRMPTCSTGCDLDGAPVSALDNAALICAHAAGDPSRPGDLRDLSVPRAAPLPCPTSASGYQPTYSPRWRSSTDGGSKRGRGSHCTSSTAATGTSSTHGCSRSSPTSWVRHPSRREPVEDGRDVRVRAPVGSPRGSRRQGRARRKDTALKFR